MFLAPFFAYGFLTEAFCHIFIVKLFTPRFFIYQMIIFLMAPIFRFPLFDIEIIFTCRVFHKRMPF